MKKFVILVMMVLAIGMVMTGCQKTTHKSIKPEIEFVEGEKEVISKDVYLLHKYSIDEVIDGLVEEFKNNDENLTGIVCSEKVSPDGTYYKLTAESEHYIIDVMIH